MSENVLTIENATMQFGGVVAVDDLELEVNEGEIVALIGPNGAGKTTALKSMLSLVHPDGGSIEFFGLDFKEHEREIKKKIGFVSGGFSYYPHKKLKAITAATRAFYPDWREDAYNGYIKKFGLDEAKTPAQLSDGMKVKYALALALSHGAQLLILDEPLHGLDCYNKERARAVIEAFCRRPDKTMIYVTHYERELPRGVDKKMVLQKHA